MGLMEKQLGLQEGSDVEEHANLATQGTKALSWWCW